VSFFETLLSFLLIFLTSCSDKFASCLHPADEDLRVFERIAALERASRDTDTLLVDPRRRNTVVLLQDRAQHIGEVVDGCQRSLKTMYSIILPRNPPPESFRQLLDAFRSSQ
jgi:hypothetical protein